MPQTKQQKRTKAIAGYQSAIARWESDIRETDRMLLAMKGERVHTDRVKHVEASRSLAVDKITKLRRLVSCTAAKPLGAR
jgi:hypothetical protein